MQRRLMSIAAALLVVSAAFAQTYYVNRVNIPDVAGFLTLQCDFHVHTVFSDGDVWPTFRVQEAVTEGLDAIAMTDHVEYQPKGEYVSKDRNASYRIAQQAAADAGLILIPGAEITRSMPPGHLNAIFVQDANALAKENWRDAISEAVRQGAIIFWNHPGWASQQPDGVAKWYREHDSLYEKGVLAGMEVVNSNEYYPEVLTWCLEKRIAILGNSDTHGPIDFEYGVNPERLRPMTLVFARERSAAAIREAILERRTAVRRGRELIGKEEWLARIFENSISFNTKNISAKGRERVLLRVTNSSGISYTLVLAVPDTNIQFPREIELAAGRTALVPVRARKSSLSLEGPVTVHYEVKNLLVGAGRALQFPLTFQASVKPKN
jgi:hypothetical protein